ncbi:MAG TPA: fibronectin type III domain-containing protein, partial [Steroidobacteraceae bacterium]|nr:fibronectin type III domain-containing protein [Steroidobacteraceae bacterium]
MALVAFGFSAAAHSAIAYVQGSYATPQTNQTTVAVAYPSAQTAGNLNVVVVGWNDATSHVLSVTDLRGNTYQLAVGPTVYSGVASQAVYYSAGIGGGANTVTVTFDAAARYVDVRVAEYSGVDTTNPVDVVAAATGSSATSSSGAVTTTNADDLLVGANLVQTTTTGPGAGFTQRMITVPDADILEDRIVSATGSYGATAPLSPAAEWIMQLVAFRAAPSGGGDTTAPSVPGTLAATAVSASQIDLSWGASTDNVGVTGYLIERCVGAGCSSFTSLVTVSGTTYSDTGLAASTPYSYRVRATDAANNLSAYSNTAGATTPAAPDTTPPSAPSTLTATA